MEESRKLDRTWLCSIVFSDIVNYSSQSVELQMKWKRYFNDVLAEALRSVPPDDRIVLDTGDGAAICFLGEPEVALFTTLSVRCAFIDEAAKDDSSPRIRLGINLGPVKIVPDINGNLNALGDGINVAQRVMSFAAPNQVLVSQSFYEVVSRLSDDYKPLFRYDSVRKDKHVREHTVYELTAASGGTSSIATPVAVEEHAPKYVAEKPASPKRPILLFLFAGAGTSILVALIVVVSLRSKQHATPPDPTAVSQVQQSPPAPVSPSVRPGIGAGASESTEAMAPAIRPSRRSTAASIPRAVAEPTADLTGRWQADVKYAWGASHAEVFDLKVDGGDVFGTASYLRTPRAIIDGKLEGTKLTFTTKSQAMLGDKMQDLKHQYRGRVSGDTIEFVLQTESGYDARSPETFTARRVAAAATGR